MNKNFSETMDPPDSLKSIVGDNNLAAVFSGELSYSFHVALEKFQKALAKLGEFARVVRKLRESEFFKVEAARLASAAEELDVWLELAADDLAALQRIPDFSPKEVMLLQMNQNDQISPELRARTERFRKVFDSLDERALTATTLRTCKALLPYRVFLEDLKRLNLDFVLRMPDGVFQPLPFAPSFNVAAFMTDDEEARHNKFLMVSMRMFMILSHDFFQLYKQPNVDPELIRQQFLEAIEALEKHPQLHTCRDGIRLIRGSVDQYVEGYGRYNSVEGGAAGGLFMFMNDVATKKLQKKDMRARRQITTIIRVATEGVAKLSPAQRHSAGIKADFMGNISSATDALVAELDAITENGRDEDGGEPDAEPAGAAGSAAADEGAAAASGGGSANNGAGGGASSEAERAAVVAELMRDPELNPDAKGKRRAKAPAKAKRA